MNNFNYRCIMTLYTLQKLIIGIHDLDNQKKRWT